MRYRFAGRIPEVPESELLRDADREAARRALVETELDEPRPRGSIDMSADGESSWGRDRRYGKPGGFLRLIMERFAEASRPPEKELFDVLERAGAQQDLEWARSVERGLAAIEAAGGQPSLSHCDYEPGDCGFLSIAGANEALLRDVREGDAVVAGFVALRDALGALQVWPRVVRKVCANGAVHLGGCRAAILERTGSPERAVVECMSAALLDETVDTYRRAANEVLEEPLRLLETLTGFDDDLQRRAVWTRFARDGDFTRWGLANAVTAEAREISDLRRRVAIEHIGARIAEGARAAVHHAPLARERVSESALPK